MLSTKRKASIDTIRPAKKVIIEKTEEIDGLKSENEYLKTEINRLNCGSKKLPVPDKHHCKEWMKICCIENSGEQHVDDLRKKQAHRSYVAYCNSVRARPAGSGKDFPRILLECGHPVTNAGEGRGGNQQKVTGLRFNPATVETTIGGKDCNRKEWVKFVKLKNR